MPSYYRLNDMMLPSSGSCSSVREAQEVVNRQLMGFPKGEDSVSCFWVIGFLEKDPWELGKMHTKCYEIKGFRFLSSQLNGYLEDLGPLGVRG